jgi:hypothetical protein
MIAPDARYDILAVDSRYSSISRSDSYLLERRSQIFIYVQPFALHEARLFVERPN